jgi:hypothetical protein
MSKQTVRNHINKSLSKIGTYHNEIPLDTIFSCIKANGGTVVQEDDTEWNGFMCGEQGSCNLPIIFENMNNMFVSISWYKMGSGRYEIVVYVS